MFRYETQIYLHHTDAAGRLFFANQFTLMHEAKEKLFESLGVPIGQVLSDPKYTFPLVHAEADYKAVLEAGDKIVIEVKVEKIGETSIIFDFKVLKADGTLAGTGKTVNVCMDKATRTKAPIPPEWLTCFQQE